MAASPSQKFGAPQTGAETDVGAFKKLAFRVENTLSTKVLNSEAKQLDPHSVLVSPLNRDGAPPNVQHVHSGILKSFATKGFDRTRPAVGICVAYTSSEGKAALLEHNMSFSKGEALLPPIHAEGPLYGSLAGSHLNLALRVLKSGSYSTVGDLKRLLSESQSLEEMVTAGHRWWILPEDVPANELIDISLWRNQDQNENQGTHEVEVLQSIISSARLLGSQRKSSSVVSLADLIAYAQRRNPAKLSPMVLTTMTRYFSQFLADGCQHLVTELVDYHSVMVNPRELVVSNRFFANLTKEAGFEKTLFVKHYLVLTQYTTEGATANAHGPSTAAFLEQQALQGLAKKPELVAVENRIRQLRDQYLPLLEGFMGPKQARLAFASLMDAFIRGLLGKPLPEHFARTWPKSARRAFGEEFVKSLLPIWASQVDAKYQIAFAKAADLEAVKVEADEDPEKQQVNLGNLRALKKADSDGAPEAPKGLQRGDLVTVVRRMSWPIPGGSRRDIQEGTEGIVEGFADKDNKSVLVRVTVHLASGPLEVVHACNVQNLQLSEDFKLAQAAAEAPEDLAEGAGAAGASGSGGSTSAPAWLLETAPPGDEFRVETAWRKLLADRDATNALFWLKSRIGVCLQGLCEAVPQYTGKDLLVVNRGNEKGAFKTEVWTLRDFPAKELVFAPLVSQIRETHLARQASHAPLGLPKVGPGKHPQSLGLALDGRQRAMLAAQGSVDDAEHTGLLFFAVTRSSSASEANMAFDAVTFEHTVVVKLPLKRKSSSATWESQHLPSVPILVNPKAIKARTRLGVHQPREQETKEGGVKEQKKK